MMNGNRLKEIIDLLRNRHVCVERAASPAPSLSIRYTSGQGARSTLSARFNWLKVKLVACGKNMQYLLQFVAQVRNACCRAHGEWKSRLAAIGFDFFTQLSAGAGDCESVFIE